jgi:hypothetical protein
MVTETDPAGPARATPPEHTTAGTAPETPSATPATSAVQDPAKLLAAHEALKADHKAVTARLKALEDANLSEQEKLTRHAKRLEAELGQAREDMRDRINRYEVQLAAGKLGIVDPEAAVKLLDWSVLEYAEDGSPKNVTAALTALVEARPWLKTQEPAAAPPPGQPARTANPARQTTPPAERIWTQAEIADPAVWRQHREEITQAMREGRVVQ